MSFFMDGEIMPEERRYGHELGIRCRSGGEGGVRVWAYDPFL